MHCMSLLNNSFLNEATPANPTAPGAADTHRRQGETGPMTNRDQSHITIAFTNPVLPWSTPVRQSYSLALPPCSDSTPKFTTLPRS